MPRVAGIELPKEKRIDIALTYLYGIGRKNVVFILKSAGLEGGKRAKDLTDDDIAKINNAIVELNLPVEGEMRRIINQNIRRLKEIKCYRGLRHHIGLPTRGQNTRTNSRTRKGKRKTVGGQKKKLAKK